MFKDKNFEKTVQYKVGKFNGEELTEEDLSNVMEITINNINIRGEKLDVDISELSMLNKLKHLSLKAFNLTDEEIDMLNSMRYFNFTTYAMWV